MNTHAAGVDGEDAACRYLESCGYAVFARNWRTRNGEIDIIATDTDTLVFVEVKHFAKTPAAELSRAVNIQKQRRIVETAKCFLDIYRKFSGMYIRFDVILIGADLRDISHIQSAFSESV